MSSDGSVGTVFGGRRWAWDEFLIKGEDLPCFHNKWSSEIVRKSLRWAKEAKNVHKLESSVESQRKKRWWPDIVRLCYISNVKTVISSAFWWIEGVWTSVREKVAQITLEQEKSVLFSLSGNNFGRWTFFVNFSRSSLTCDGPKFLLNVWRLSSRLLSSV